MQSKEQEVDDIQKIYVDFAILILLILRFHLSNPFGAQLSVVTQRSIENDDGANEP